MDKTRFSPVVVVPQQGPLTERLTELDIPVEIFPSLMPWLTRRTGLMKLAHFLACLPFILISVWKFRQIINKSGANLVHTNSLVTIEGALAARIAGLPHIWHARELLIPETVFNFFLGPQVVGTVVSYLSDQVIAMSWGVKEVFCQGGDCSKVAVIYDGFDTTNLLSSRARSSIRAELDIPAPAPLVGVIGRVTKIKGIEDLVRAAIQVREVHPEARFVVIGGKGKADRPYEARILALIKEHQLESYFQFTGYRADIETIIPELDLLVLPSHTEAFGRVLLEAMAAGKPVVGTRVGGIPEIIDEGVTGFVVPSHTPEALAGAIIQILQDSSLAQKMGAEGAHKVKTQFTISRQIAETQKIYETIVKDREVSQET